MRFILPLLSLGICVGSIWVGLANVPASSPICLSGLCRMDQLYATLDSQGTNTTALAAFLNEDPWNPAAWCTYAEALALQGNVKGAEQAFARAIALGPGISPVLMRAANFYFSHGQMEPAYTTSRTILHQTSAFDEIIFSYLARTTEPLSGFLDKAIPPESRPVAAWFQWVLRTGAPRDVLDNWSWIIQHHLNDPELALNATVTLWRKKDFLTAQRVWAEGLGEERGDYLHPQLLFNRRLEEPSNMSPFEWTFRSPSSVQLSHSSGLTLHFQGSAKGLSVRQFTAVEPGAYRFSAEIETSDISPGAVFLHVLDAEPGRKFEVRSPKLEGTMVRQWVTVDFRVPQGVGSVEVSLECKAPQGPDDGINGALHIYQVSLVPIPAGPISVD